MERDCESLVSIIMPAYNAERYISDAIKSVINQTYRNWQLIVVNDGSQDHTESIVSAFNDNRMVYFSQVNKGVAAARNVGLENANGHYVCFLDADDVLPANSLMDRIMFFKDNPGVDFVDGIVHVTGNDIADTIRIWQPSFRGEAKRELIHLKDTCFITISWMIRREAIALLRFQEGITHAEDLVFLAEISGGRIYDFVGKPILYYRRHDLSAMSDLDGLANGYWNMFQIFKRKHVFANRTDRLIYKFKMTKIMFLSYLAAGRSSKAFHFLIKGMAA